MLEDAKSLSGKVSGNDRMKLDEYLTAVREIEQRIERAEGESALRPNVLAGLRNRKGFRAATRITSA